VLTLVKSKYKLYQVDLTYRSSTFNLDHYEKRIKDKIAAVEEEFKDNKNVWAKLEAYEERVTMEGDDLSFNEPILEYDEKQTFGDEECELEDAF
jgi:hypothetical protein